MTRTDAGSVANAADPVSAGSPLELICRDHLLAKGRRQWLENSGCAARGSFTSGGFRLDQGGRVLLAQGSLVLGEGKGSGENAAGMVGLLGSLCLELWAHGAEPLGLLDSLRVGGSSSAMMAAHEPDQIRGELQTAARSLGLGVFGGECGRSLQASDAIFVVMVGVLPRVPRRDRAKRGRAGDRVYRVCLPEATPGERPSNVLAVGHALRDACQKDALSWVGNCRDGGLIAVVDWLETTGKGLRLEPIATGRAALVDPEPDAFFIAALGDTNPAALLPDNVKVVEVGSIGEERLVDLETPEGPTLRLRPEEIRRDQQPPEFADADLGLASPLAASEDYEQTLRELFPDFRMLSPRNTACREASPEGLPRLSGDVGLVRLGARRDLLALAVGSAQSFSSLDPYIGACLAVCRVTRALAASGAEALGLLVTLPGEKEPGADLVYEGLRHAADGLGTTVEMAIASDGAGAAPVVMALGRPSATRLVPSRFQRPGDLAVLLGRTREELSGSLYERHLRGVCPGTPPWVDLNAERRLQDLVRLAGEGDLLQSALSLMSGGLIRGALEACGIDDCEGQLLGLVGESDETIRPDAWLFAESPSRILVSVAPEDFPLLKERADRAQIQHHFLGEIGGDRLEIRGQLSVALESLRRAWHGSTDGDG